MVNKHPLVPHINIRSEKVYKFSDKANICGSCNLPASKCSIRCKRYKEELAKLKQGSKSESNGKPN